MQIDISDKIKFDIENALEANAQLVVDVPTEYANTIEILKSIKNIIDAEHQKYENYFEDLTDSIQV